MPFYIDCVNNNLPLDVDIIQINNFIGEGSNTFKTCINPFSRLLELDKFIKNNKKVLEI